MGARGRRGRGSAGLPTVPPTRARPGPPAELTAEEAAEWRAVVGRMPADWFTRETHALLVQFCRHVVAARMISRRLARSRSQAIETLNLLLQMQDRERKAMESLATKMRLTQSSRYDKKKTTGPASGKRPWEYAR